MVSPTAVSELSATAIDTSRALSSVPSGEYTELVLQEVEKEYRVVKLSPMRRLAREAISVIRLCVAGFLTFQGTQYLVYTIAIEELLLNAVALEFVISLDELVFESLAPAHAKRLVSRTLGFKVSTKEYKGMDSQALLSFVLIVVQMLWAVSNYMSPQLTVLEGVKAAICSGDRDFVFAIDGMGTVVWGYPPGVAGTPEDPSFIDVPSWPVRSDEALSVNEQLVDSILQGNGRSPCQVETCYIQDLGPALRNIIPRPASDRASCCVPRQSKAPSIEFGRFSVLQKSTNSVADTTTMCDTSEPFG